MSGHCLADDRMPRQPTSAQPTATYFALARPCVQLFVLPRRIAPVWPAARPCRAR